MQQHVCIPNVCGNPSLDIVLEAEIGKTGFRFCNSADACELAIIYKVVNLI